MITALNPGVNILLLNFIASLGTGIGGLLSVIRRPSRRPYGLLMGITAGVMICLSFLELVNQAWNLAGWVTATIGFGVFCLSFAITQAALSQKIHIRRQEGSSYNPEISSNRP